MSFKKISAVALTAMSLCSSSYAVLTGHGGYTTDSATGLDWLSITATAGISYNEVIAGYGGYIASGWRYASTQDVVTLFDHAGGGNAPYTDTSFTAQYAAPAGLLLSLLGASYAYGNGLGNTEGLTSASIASGTHEMAVFQDDGSYGYMIADWTSADDNAPPWNAGGGSFLVRQTSNTFIPEPASLALLGLGFAGLVSCRRNARQA